MFKKLNPKQKYTASILLTILAPIIFVIIIISPLLSKITKFSKEYVEAKKELITLEIKRGFIKDFEKEIFEKEADFPKVEKAFLSEDNIVDFVKSIEKFALDSGVQAEIKSISEADKTTVMPFIKVQISLKGSYAGLIKFIQLLENMKNYTTLDSLQMRKEKGKSDIETTLSVKVYIKK